MLVVVNSWGSAAQKETDAVWMSAPFNPTSSSLFVGWDLSVPKETFAEAWPDASSFLLLGGILAFPKGPLQTLPGQMPPAIVAVLGRQAAGVAGAVSPAFRLDPTVVLGCF